MPSKRALAAYIRLNAVLFAVGYLIMSLIQRPMETILTVAALMCAGAIIGLVYLGGKLTPLDKER